MLRMLFGNTDKNKLTKVENKAISSIFWKHDLFKGEEDDEQNCSKFLRKSFRMRVKIRLADKREIVFCVS